MKRQITLKRLSIGLIVVLVLVSFACQLFAPLREQATPMAAASATPAPPTLTPMPLPAPRLLFRSPEVGEKQGVASPVELTFDQPMDRESVEDAFSISPEVAGKFTWRDDRTVLFAAQAPFDRGAAYQITVDDTARNREGAPLSEPVTVDFTTVGFLEVSQVQPVADSKDLNPDTLITVVFNRPVVPLTALNRQSELPNPLTLQPSVKGEGEWLNTSTYVFRPEAGFLPATQYRARIAAGLEDTLGEMLKEDFTWEFGTLRPVVTEIWPENGFQYFGPADVISVTFNQPMDHTSAEEQFTLQVDGQPVEGRFRWAGGETPLASETMGFIPAAALPRGVTCVARVAEGIRPLQGEGETRQVTTSLFHTVKPPAVVQTYPEDGAVDVDPYSDIAFTFAGPMDTDAFMDHLQIAPSVTDVYTYWSDFNTVGHLSLNLEPATAYQIVLDGAMPDAYGATLGEAVQVRFTTGDLSPSAWLNTRTNLETFSTYTDTVVYATVQNVSRLDVSLYTLPVETFMELNGYGEWDAWELYQPQAGQLVRQWSQAVDVPRNEAVYLPLALTEADGSALLPGLYYMEMTAPEVLEADPEATPSRFMFVKSGVNLTLKQGEGESLVWATDLRTGEPVSSLGVRFNSKEAGWHGAGVTNAEGLYQAQQAEGDEAWVESPWDSYFAFAGEPGDERFAVAFNDWSDGISPWEFGVQGDYDLASYRGYLYTDRPIYRPDQTVYFKGIMRQDEDGSYRLPVGLGDVRVRIDDPQGKELYNELLSLNEMGTLHGELLLSAEAPLGTYYLTLSHDDVEFYASTSFQVAEYRKPEYEVQVEPERDAYMDGNRIAVTTEATYYFGGAVADADVRWSALSSGYTFEYHCPAGEVCPRYSWTDYDVTREEDDEFYYDSYGKLIAEGEAKTDAQGRVTFRVPADISKETQSRRFTLEAAVTDINGQEVSNRAAVIVHQGAFYVGLAPRGYLAEVGEKQQVDVLTADWESKPVPRIPLEVVFLEEKWYSVRQQADNGGYYWDWTVEEVPVFTTTVTTDGKGRAVAAFTPERPGSYKVRAVGRDNYEHRIRSSAFFWVWGGGYVSWRQENNNRIDLVADRDKYAVGDTAEILIPSPYSGTVKALVTIERGHVLETSVRTLQSNAEVLRIPIEEDYAPNVFVSVLLMQGADRAPDGLASFKMGVVDLPVSVEEKELTITLTPDRLMEKGETYKPRQKAVYTVRVTDSTGEPVEAELSLRLADLAVLALADDPGPTLLDSFWSERGLGVRTSLPLVVAMEPYNRDLAPGAKGGGGGADFDAGGLVRSKFADTAFWDPVVRTDENGTAKVEVELPDNLTTWRMQARGITAETQVGHAEVDVLSTLDLLVRPVLPRFFVVGDHAEIATVINNNTDASLEAEVRIRVEGLSLEGPDHHTVRISGGDTVRVAWPVTALAESSAVVRMEAVAEDGLSDAREDTLPIYRYATPEVVATAGRLSEAGVVQEVVQLPRSFDPTQGELTVQLDGSLTAATQDALSYLKHYPYECTEQTVSRFLPNVLTYRALEEMDLERPELRAELTEGVGLALQRLYNEQHYDGGWGWWVSDESDAYLTAYVLQGLLEAHRAGFVVERDVMDQALGFLRENLAASTAMNPGWRANRLAYQLYVMADYATQFEKEEVARDLGRAVQLFDRREQLSTYGRAMLAVALHLMEPEEPSRVDTLLSDLAGEAVLSATGTHWEEAEPDYWNMNTDIRTTAIAIWALARLDPEDTQIPNAVRWLMSVRKEGAWETTQATSWSLLALVEVMRTTGELEGDFDYTVYLNGRALEEGVVAQETIDESQELQVAIAQLLVEEGNRLVIERHRGDANQTGEGQLYYTAQLRYYLPAEEVEALDRGMVIARQYSLVDTPGQYIERADVGDVVRVKLTLVAPTDLYYVVVEDPLPAGFEAVDVSLKTTSIVGRRPGLRNLTAEEENEWFHWQGWGWWWFSHAEMRDEKVALFASYLPRGTYEYTYMMRANVPGEFQVMPATASEMYFPEVFGRSDGGVFTVEGE